MVGSACIAYFWFSKIGPWRHVCDPNWLRQHSEEAYWNEVKISISRLGWQHDEFAPAGSYGDAQFMAWMMARINPGDDISSCVAGHKDNAFREITNQDAGENAIAWLNWWKVNKSKSQVEWLRDGFAQHDITVTIPPSNEDTVPLLRLLGDSSEPETVPPFVKHNAFRWLRDSDFNPVEFALSDDAGSLDDTARAGLLEYLRRERYWPKKDRVGILAFGEMEDPYSGFLIPAMLEPKFQATVYALIVGPLCIGIGLVAWTFRRRRHSVLQSDGQMTRHM
jgi:hypothetical protein